MQVNKDGRVLLIVNCLSRHGDSRFYYLYKFIEFAGVDVAKRCLSDHYSQISVLKDAEASKQQFISRLRSICEDRRVITVDLFFQLHGLAGKAGFFDQWVSTSALGEEIRQVVKKSSLRLVYNTSCYGDSHSGDFIKAGFQVSVGAVGVNANAATEYPLFCRSWAKSAGRSDRMLPLTEVVRRADRPLPRLIQDSIAGRYFDDVESRKIIRGNGAVTIETV